MMMTPDALNVALADIQLCVSGRPIRITGINYFGFDVRMPWCCMPYLRSSALPSLQALCCMVIHGVTIAAFVITQGADAMPAGLWKGPSALTLGALLSKTAFSE